MRDKDFKADIHGKTSAAWALQNPYLPKNDLGVETDTGLIKIGIGQRWASTDALPPPGFTGFTRIVALTQSAYDALTPDADTLYVITPNP